MAPAAVRLVDLTKYFGAVVGVDRLSLDIAPGEVFGFLGANGAGKTTTIRLLLDLLRPSGGEASIAGFDTRRQSLEVRRRVGYLPGDMPIYPELTGAGYLRFLAAIGTMPVSLARLEQLFRRFDISDLDLGRRMRDYSHGMKRKLGIIQALMANAPVVILDEPTSGLDPLMIEAFSETIDDLARDGRTTVFLSSHVLSEVDRVCHRIGLVRSGRLVAVRTLGELRASAPRHVTVTFSESVSAPPPPGVTVVSCEPHRWRLEIEGPLGPLLKTLACLPVADIEATTVTLADTVLRLMDEGRS
jgi:beta-exotoxin I transport system ATP-binding protein